MKLMAEAGLWSTGALATPTPLVAVLEVSGAVWSWTVDDAAAVQLTFTDAQRADWLWRVVGEDGHAAVAAALQRGRPEGHTIDLAGVELRAAELGPLRRLALGHWLRRWWPASQRDGIAVLDSGLLDAEVALLTAAAQDYFTDDTFDSDVAALLSPHGAALNTAALQGDPRVIDVVDRCRELADDVGVVFDTAATLSRRDDYALAAGGPSPTLRADAVAHGTASLRWAAVPPGVFDAAEDTVDWRVQTDGVVTAVLRVELTGAGSPNGIAVRLRSGPLSGVGKLGADGRSTFPLVDAEQQPVTESAAWNHDWRGTQVIVGVEAEESAQTRERVRAYARSRLARPADDAFLAEVLAAEADY